VRKAALGLAPAADVSGLSLKVGFRLPLWGPLGFRGPLGFGVHLVLICWELAGRRGQLTVPLLEARWHRQQLENTGAVVYWSQRLSA
jgi:hypothetical protein